MKLRNFHTAWDLWLTIDQHFQKLFSSSLKSQNYYFLFENWFHFSFVLQCVWGEFLKENTLTINVTLTVEKSTCLKKLP